MADKATLVERNRSLLDDNVSDISDEEKYESGGYPPGPPQTQELLDLHIMAAERQNVVQAILLDIALECVRHTEGLWQHPNDMVGRWSIDGTVKRCEYLQTKLIEISLSTKAIVGLSLPSRELEDYNLRCRMTEVNEVFVNLKRSVEESWITIERELSRALEQEQSGTLEQHTQPDTGDWGSTSDENGESV